MPLTALANAVYQPPEDSGGTQARMAASDPEPAAQGITETRPLKPSTPARQPTTPPRTAKAPRYGESGYTESHTVLREPLPRQGRNADGGVLQMLTDDEAEKALHFLISNAKTAGELRGERVRREAMLKHIKAVLSGRCNAKSAAEREAWAYAHGVPV